MKKLLAILLALVMVIGTMPVQALFSSADPYKLGGYIAAAGFGFEYDASTQNFKIAYDFDLGGDAALEADPEIVPETMSNNAANYGFAITLTDSQGSVQTQPVVTLGEKGKWASTDVAIYFDLSPFSLTNGETYTVRIDITTPGGNEYYVEEGGLGFNFAPLVDVASTPISGTSISWSFKKSNGTLTISGTGDMPDFANLTDRPWNDVAYGVQKIIVSQGVTSVGKQTGARMTNLNEVEIAEGVTKLGMDVFAYCGKIEKVTLPGTLTYIGQGTLYSSTIGIVMCTLTREELRAQCTTIGAYNDSLFNAKWWYDPIWGLGYNWSFDEATGTLTITGTGVMPNFDDFGGTRPWDDYTDQVTAIVIEDGVTSIQPQAFNNMANVDSVTMPDTVTQIGGDAFAHCKNISYFRLSSEVTTISQGVVYDCVIATVSCKKDWRAIMAQATVGNYNDAFADAFAQHHWIDCEIFGPALSFGKYGTGIENWEGNGDPNLTQILIATPKWDGTYAAALNNAQWTLVIAPADGDYETEPPVTLVAYPRSVYDAGTWSILRFVPALSTDPAGRFIPIKDKHYKITATVTYNGETSTVTGSEEYWITADPVLFDDYVNITWQIEGVTEYVDNIPRGFKPVYHGSAASYTEGTTAYVVNIPETVVADGDATYNITYTATDMTAGTLGLWGSGYENWAGGTGGEQTQLLLRPKDWQGNDLTQFDGTEAMQAVDWILTINGVEYTVKPSTHYSAMIFRFEPALWETPLCLVPGTYSVGLVIKDAEGAVVFYTTENTTITVAEDFVPVHRYEDVVTEPTATARGYTTHTCSVCGDVVVDTYTVLPGYYLVGGVNEWTLDPAYMFEAIGDTGVYVLKGVELPANAEFKVLKTEDGATYTDEDYYPAGNNATVGAAHAYNVYFRPTGDDQNANWYEGTLRAVYCRDYYLAGTNNGWNETADIFTEIENTGVFEITGVTFGAGGEFKITGADGFWYPDNNYVVNDAGVYKVLYDEKYDVITVEAAPANEEGDVNGDGEVTISDVTALLDYLAASEEDAAAMIENGVVVADQLSLDGNDTVTISDVTALLFILAGQTAAEGS